MKQNQTEVKGKAESSIILVGDFNTLNSGQNNQMADN